MKALITGGTSGIGKAIAEKLNTLGYELVIVGSRDTHDVSMYTKAKYISCDLTKLEEAQKLLDETKDEEFDIFVDNAGYGDIGSFLKTDTVKEMNMIDLNCKTMQYLLKEMMKKMVAINKGRILVTSSIASYASAPYMATYYATKAYVYHLALGYSQELKDLKSKVTISILCPGPVATNFEKTANVDFSMKPISPEKVARIAVKGLLKGKRVILPGFGIKLLAFASKIAPNSFTLFFCTKSARIRNESH